MDVFGFLKRSKAAQVNAAELAPLNAWLLENGFDPADVSFSVYRDENLMRADSTLLVVGFGQSDGAATGFAAEFAGLSLVEARNIHPGAASYHKQVASAALYSGSRLLHGLVAKSLEMNSR